jgi:hypothetical protein
VPRSRCREERLTLVRVLLDTATRSDAVAGELKKENDQPLRQPMIVEFLPQAKSEPRRIAVVILA